MVSSGSRKEQVLWREIGRPAPRARSPPARRAATTPTPTTHRQGGWIFTQPSSKLLDPRRDWDKWKNILREAEVRDAPGYTTRGTRPQPCCSCSASKDRAVMDFMGWSSTPMMVHHMLVPDGLRRDVADQLNGYCLRKPE